jgi:exosortase family protein XrtM
MHENPSTLETNESKGSSSLGWRFACRFLVIFILVSLAWSCARDTGVERFVVEEATVATSARIISMIDPDQKIRSEGFHLLAPHVRLSVLNGCEGTESILMLAAAILACAAPWRRKLAGMLLGAGCIFLLNQLRLIALFYTLRYKAQWFGSVHGYIAPLLIIIGGSLFFFLWMHWSSQEHRHALIA